MSHDFWSVILIAGLIGWLFSVVMLIFRAFPRKDVFVAASGIRWGGLSVLSFAVWVVALLNA